MAINFPSSPTEGQVHNVSPGNSFVYRSGVWVPAPMKTALPKNYIVNPGMQISQQNGSTVVAKNGFPADQWSAFANALNVNWQKTNVGEGPCISVSIATGQPTLAAGEFVLMLQTIEQARYTDLQMGTANAKSVVVRFMIYPTISGNFSIFLRVQGGGGYYTALFSVTASIWNTVSIPIPGCNLVSANWQTYGMELGIVLACGSSYTAPVDRVWQTLNYYASPGTTNGAATTGNTFYIKDVGLYADPYKTGVTPPFVVPDYAAELLRCQRYWYPAYGLRGVVVNATTPNTLQAPFRTPMRAIPAVTLVGAPSVYDYTAAIPVTSITANTSNHMGIELNTTASAGGMVTGRPAANYWTTAANYFACSARM